MGHTPETYIRAFPKHHDSDVRKIHPRYAFEPDAKPFSPDLAPVMPVFERREIAFDTSIENTLLFRALEYQFTKIGTLERTVITPEALTLMNNGLAKLTAAKALPDAVQRGVIADAHC